MSIKEQMTLLLPMGCDLLSIDSSSSFEQSATMYSNDPLFAWVALSQGAQSEYHVLNTLCFPPSCMTVYFYVGMASITTYSTVGSCGKPIHLFL